MNEIYKLYIYLTKKRAVVAKGEKIPNKPKQKKTKQKQNKTKNETKEKRNAFLNELILCKHK